MKARLLALAAKFDALQPREKVITTAAMVIGIVMLGHTFFIEPPQLRSAMLKKQIAQKKTELQTLQAQLVVISSQGKDPDAPNLAVLKEIKAQLASSERTLHGFDGMLVPPGKIAQLLQSLLMRYRGLELVSLKTLAPTPLLASAPAKTEVAKPDAKVPPPAPARGEGIHKHGIEIRMAGNYLDLLSYVSELEQLPQKLLWGRMSLTVTGYPRSEMTLMVYTLSLDSRWMVV